MGSSKRFHFWKADKIGDSTDETRAQQQVLVPSHLDAAYERLQGQSSEDAKGKSSFEDDPARFGLKVLVSQPATREQCVDIVAIHGLNGHYDATWRDRTTGANWLKDPEFLPKDIPNARIQSFGYNSVSYFSTSNANVRDFASELLASINSSRREPVEKKRPIVFICHSLGGIVFKQAVIRAHEQNEHYSNILENIQGVAFFGTPHHGSDLAFWDHVGTMLVRAVSLGYSTNVQLSKDLKIDSGMLRRISESFAYRGAKMKIRSFYETELIKGLNCRVVERSSSILNWPNEIDIAASANHSSICKFPRPGDSRYKTVWHSITEIMERGEVPENISLTEEEKVCLREFDSDYESHLSQVDDPVSGTCCWILDHEKWAQFDSSPTSALLWITADAGCGKSVAAKYLIDHHKAKSTRRNVCYFFFKESFEYQNNAQSALSAILHQIYCLQPFLLKHAMTKYTTTPKRTFKQFSCLQSMLMSTIEDESFRDTLCIIDGLDECEPKSRDLLVKSLATYFTTSVQSDPVHQAPFKMVIFSRPDNLIQRRLQLFGKDSTDKTYLGLQRKSRLMAEEEATAIAKDINLFVRAKIEEFGPKSELSEDILAKVEDRLIHGADFTFLWVSLVVKLLEDAEVDGISREQLEAILLTTNLDELYRRLLTARKYPLKTRKILYIVIAAARPLTLEEMCVAVEVHQDYYPRDSEELSSKKLGSSALSTADIHSAGPSQSYGKVLELEILSSKLCKPFGNHLRLLCGHFIRIRANKIYLVHETAKKFLLDSQTLSKFGLGYYLRPFGWKIERPTVAELRHLKQRKMVSEDVPPQWEHSIRLDVATRYLLQVCVDYIQLFDTSPEEAYKLGMKVPKYIETHSDQPEWAFLTYASVYWVEHYRGLRKYLRSCFDSMFNSKNRNMWFRIWKSRYLDWSREDANRSPGKTSVMPIKVQQIADVSNKSAIIPPDMYSEEERFQSILDFFNLGGVDTELYDEEYLDGDHYWKSMAKAQDEEWEDDSGSESPEDRLKVSIPDRVQNFRRQHRNVVQEKIRESWDPMSPGSMNPTSVKSLDMRFKNQVDEGQAGAVTVRKGDFGKGKGKGEGEQGGRGDVYDLDGRSLTAGTGYGSGRNRLRRSSLEGLNDEEDEWENP